MATYKNCQRYQKKFGNTIPSQLVKLIDLRAYKAECEIRSSTSLRTQESQLERTGLKKLGVTMDRLVILLFAVCVIFSVEGSIDKLLKIKREASLSSRLSQDTTSDVHSRARRSSKSSYIFFDNRSGRTVQLWWRRGKQWQKFVQLGAHKTIEINTFVSDKWRATDAETNEVFVINNKKKYRPKVNTEDTRAVCIIKRNGQRDTDIKAYIETLVVLDKTVRDQFDSDSEAEKYVEVLLMLSSNAYKHKSLTQHGLKVDIVPSQIVILK
ncbi:Hypothetical predicted protein, partial [Paramuricea clavata]